MLQEEEFDDQMESNSKKKIILQYSEGNEERETVSRKTDKGQKLKKNDKNTLKYDQYQM